MIFLFAGHGGGDPGAVGVGARKESNETIMLRDAIVSNIPFGQPLHIDSDRDRLAEVLRKANTGEASVVLDLHFNASANPAATGVEVIVGDDAQPNDIALATDILNAVVARTQLKSRGIKREGETPHKRLGVMREKGAVCLLEVCFITNSGDMTVYDLAKADIAKDLAKILVKHDALK